MFSSLRTFFSGSAGLYKKNGKIHLQHHNCNLARQCEKQIENCERANQPHRFAFIKDSGFAPFRGVFSRASSFIFFSISLDVKVSKNATHRCNKV